MFDIFSFYRKNKMHPYQCFIKMHNRQSGATVITTILEYRQ